MRCRKDKDFISYFDEETGFYMRTGMLVDGKETSCDPFMATYPELLDVGIMGHCRHGKTGLCVKAGVECYQDGLHSQNPNMTYGDFEKIVSQCKGNTYQIALGGCGDPDQHEEFEKILQCCRNAGIVPNFTTSGLGMTEEIAQISRRYCGAVAVSWYRSSYTDKAIQLLLKAGVKTNIHYVLSNSTLEDALQRLQNSIDGKEKGFPIECNAVIFLLHKPVGLGTKEEVIGRDNSKFWELLAYINENEFPFKIGFDSCTVPALLGLENVNRNCMDTCEGGRFSAYISSDMKMMPCSFDNQQKQWAMDLHEHSIQEIWHSELFEDFRKHFHTSCKQCSDRETCLGGCPIVPEIVLCKKKL